MREALREVAELFPAAIISGRGREKVMNFVKLKELYYAGSHGLDISGPEEGYWGTCGVERLRYEPASEYQGTVNEVHDLLVERVREIPGSSVEHNKFCVSVHFRNCSPSDWPAVERIAESTVAQYDMLHITRGRKVIEIRPKVDWNKGKALSYLMEALSLAECEDVLPIYIGDDRTDEDAFAVLKERSLGAGILVSTKIKPCSAAISVPR